MRFRLRTLLIVLALGPMVLAAAYFEIERQQRLATVQHGKRRPATAWKEAVEKAKLVKTHGPGLIVSCPAQEASLLP
jgi:hypothetical protein